ncbi:hypothetical protein [Granulicella aggregans]|jgi:hypothetical protein|uniref:hypothetical protein n=1 Tax=Granulicella aggregans TaxID=474949 RepID=UPI0021E0EE7B|nr:hypothetical protein [Granulicella aggregans]
MLELGSQPPNTLVGVALPGWMSHEEAVRFLVHDCVFARPITEAEAEETWHVWRERAATLPERLAVAPEELPLNPAEEEHAAKFLQYLATLGVAGVRVVKIDPMKLIVFQFQIAIERSMIYSHATDVEADWLTTALPINRPSSQLEMTFSRRRFDTDIRIELPHGEYIFGVNTDSAQMDGAVAVDRSAAHGTFGPKEFLGYINTMRVGNRLLLGRGYHRTYARIAAVEGRLSDRLTVVAIDPASPVPPDSSAQRSAHDPGLSIFGTRPALVQDFFTEGLAMPVYLRRKQYRLDVSARWVAVNVE